MEWKDIIKKAEGSSFKIYDNDGTLWTLEYEFTNRNGYNEFTIGGTGSGLGTGQVVDHIVPRTDAQKKLIAIWNKYHMKEVKEKTQKIIEDVIAQNVSESASYEIEGESVDTDPKAQALAQFLELKNTSKITTDNEKRYNVGKAEYLVLTDEEADEMAEEQEVELLKDIGIDGINFDVMDYTIDHYVQKDWFEDALREMQESYVEDIQEESDGKHGNRLVHEMVENDILDKDEDLDEDGELKESVNLEDKKAEYVEYLVNNAGDPIQYYIGNFGKEDFNTVVKEGNLVDFEDLASDIVKQDGRGSILNLWDGSENEEEVNGVTYFVYQQ